MEFKVITCFLSFRTSNADSRSALEGYLRDTWKAKRAMPDLWVFQVPDNARLLSGGLKGDILGFLDASVDSACICFCTGICNISGSLPPDQISEVF